MANPRQRRKARSSSYRPVSHSMHAKRNLKKMPTIRGPKALRDAWDKQKTVKQKQMVLPANKSHTLIYLLISTSYTALGLAHSLNPLAPGGEERSMVHVSTNDTQSPELARTPSSSTPKLPQGFGRIIRDEIGNIVRVELDEDTSSLEEGGAEHSMDELMPLIAPEVLSKWASDRTIQHQPSQGKRGLLEALEQLSTPQTASNTLSFGISGVGSRHSSAGEIAYLRRLVDKYRNDVEGMTKDRKLNPEQRTAGGLRKALRRAGFGIGYSG